MLSYRARRATAALLVGTLAGCYAQKPIGVAVPAPNARVVAQLTDLGQAEMANALGPGAYEVEGDVYEATPDTVKLLMRRVEQRGGFSTTWKQEMVAFPRATLNNVSVKTLSTQRSWIAAIGITAGVIALSRLIGGLAGGIPDRGGIVDPG
jgi:hypothetical protein